uniref:serine/threonine-protein kinase Nek4 isoform X2 n=1 Tax=Denticeps clupeoides TaxID=299321 RepID=UPI0010A593F5|nr:serine/threonine-protein kinase Nek4 isoform X2 [Denticeps clupeoides]
MDHYSFIKVVGKGSYGEVTLVRHKRDGKQFVIKKLNLVRASKRERKSAEQEAQLLSQLRHPNIVTYRESWEGDDCQLYIVMGFCEGGDLYHRLKQQKGELLPERQVVEWFVQIAMALQYLHEKRILHRDLKTQNIFLTKTNIIKVGDLGIARVLQNQNDMASTLIGTPYYMSPELFSNKPYNYKSDVWALGCCVYEMSTLKHAFNAKDMNSLVYRIIEGKLPQMPSKYDPQLGELIKRMLCKKAEDRPDVKQILRQAYIKQQIAVFLETTKEKTAKSRKKAVNNKASSSAVVSGPAKGDRPQSDQSEGNARGKKRQDNNLLHHTPYSGVTDNVPLKTPLRPKSPMQDVLNHTDQSIATISNIELNMYPQEAEEQKCKKLPQAGSDTEFSNEHNHRSSVSKKGQKHDPPQPRPQKSSLGDNDRDKKVSYVSPSQCQSSSPSILPADIDRKKHEVKVFQGGAMETTAPRKAVESSQHHHERMACPEVFITPVNKDIKDDTMALLKGASHLNYSEEIKDNLESTEKLLEPFVPMPIMEVCNPAALPPVPERGASSSAEPSKSRQRRQRHREKDVDIHKGSKASSRPLPPPPVEAPPIPTRNRDQDLTEKSYRVPSSNDCTKEKIGLTQNRPLSARERRRLRQSQENPVACKASYDVVSLGCKQSDQPDYCRSSMETEKNKSEQRHSDEDECSSSTSSTERSECERREGKSESSEMLDLVKMMTQTLRMDSGDPICEPHGPGFSSKTLTEFKINRKYRDTLILHGKTPEVEEDFQLNDLSPDDASGPAKIRRVIVQLRTDVVKGLGVKLLDRVLEIMQEEDEAECEQKLREQMGEDKYKTYAVMVRQLKFFEDVAFKD